MHARSKQILHLQAQLSEKTHQIDALEENFEEVLTVSVSKTTEDL